MDNLILAINPGSTSTKIAIFSIQHNKFLLNRNIQHPASELARFSNILDQYEYRKKCILDNISDYIIDNQIVAIIGRGGLLKPLKSGIYKINETMLHDLKQGIQGQHASNLGGLLAHGLKDKIQNAQAYIADPVVVDELQDIARIVGHPLFKRKSIFHALNHKAVARKYATTIGKHYTALNLIVAHLGGGITVGAHHQGKVIDVNNALDGEGPFSPERLGSCPTGEMANLCFSGKYTLEEVKKIITGQGGLVAYCGTNNMEEIEQRIKNGDTKAKEIRDAMAYQIAKEIGAMASVLKGKVDAIILTGGLAYNEAIINQIKEMVSFICNIVVYPGEGEMEALVYNVLLALNGEIEICEYC